MNVLQVPKGEVFVAYSLTAISAPTIGVILGGVITTKVIGGYTSSKAIYVCLFMGCLASIDAFPIPFVTKFWEFIVLLWFLLFFGGFMMPNLTGILLNSVPMRERSMAAAISQFFFNGFGYLPAPYLYGLVNEETRVNNAEGKNISRYGMIMLMYSSLIGVASLGIAICLNSRSRRNANKLADEAYGPAFKESEIENIIH